MRVVLVSSLLLGSLLAAHAFGLGEGNRFGRLGASGKKGVVIPQPTGKILAVDGVSFILQTDGVSKICRAGGC